MANANDIETSYISFNNSFLDFNIMNQYDRITYIADVAYKAGFASLVNVFVVQLCNFPSLEVEELHIVQSIIYKLKFKKLEVFSK